MNCAFKFRRLFCEEEFLRETKNRIFVYTDNISNSIGGFDSPCLRNKTNFEEIRDINVNKNKI